MELQKSPGICIFSRPFPPTHPWGFWHIESLTVIPALQKAGAFFPNQRAEAQPPLGFAFLSPLFPATTKEPLMGGFANQQHERFLQTFAKNRASSEL